MRSQYFGGRGSNRFCVNSFNLNGSLNQFCRMMWMRYELLLVLSELVYE